MTHQTEQQLHTVDWSSLPQPKDDGGANHLIKMGIPDLELTATQGFPVNISALVGRTVVFAYPRTGRPDQSLPEGWDLIPGARGCTPQSCAFRDLNTDLMNAGVDHLFGLSTQEADYQKEAAARLHLPFPLLSDAQLAMQTALNLPTMMVNGDELLKRLTLVIDDAVIQHVFYPVFPPDQSADDVLKWAQANTRT